MQQNLASRSNKYSIFFFYYFNYPRRRGTSIFAFRIEESAFELFSQMSRDIFFWRSYKKSGEKYLLDVRRDAPRLCHKRALRERVDIFSLSMHIYSSVASNIGCFAQSPIVPLSSTHYTLYDMDWTSSKV